MTWIFLSCPQCSAPLPRVAIWRAVKCPACGSLVTRTESIVNRDSFRQALVRAREGIGSTGTDIRCGSEDYQLIRLLDQAEASETHLARRTGIHTYLATVKISLSPEAATRSIQEAVALRDFRAPLGGSASIYAARCLPELIAEGPIENQGSRHALVFTYRYGYWGTLAALCGRFPSGIDPRHGVWIWRRMLDALHFIHTLDWAHGDLRPENALIHPRDHAIQLTGWAAAKKNVSPNEQARDLQRAARMIQVLLAGGSSMPPPLADLLERACQDENFCKTEGARGLDQLLRRAALSAFGPPSFVPLLL